MKQLRELKAVYYEPNNSKNYSKIIKKYYRDVYTKGALLFAVCRGKISEGLDFSDDAARTVIQVGIPFPMLKDPRTMMKQQYLDKLR